MTTAGSGCGTEGNDSPTHRRRFELVYAGALLALWAGIGLAPSIPRLGLIGDDWWYFAHLSDHEFFAAQLYENPARPLVACLWPAP